MGKNRFEKTDVVRLTLSDGDWIEVRRRLSGVEQKRMQTAAFNYWQGGKGGTASDARLGLDVALLSLSRTLTYLKDWNFRDAHDKPVKCTPEAIEALDQETLDEIEKALDAHITAQDAEKKDQNGEPKPLQAWPSAVS